MLLITKGNKRNISERISRRKTLVSNILRMEMVCFGQSTLFKSCLIRKNWQFVFRVDNPAKFVELRLYSNEKYMKAIEKQKVLIMLVKIIRQKAKER